MTHLRKMMLEELERRNYAQSTTHLYLQTIEDFARYFKRPPDQLGPEHIRQYQVPRKETSRTASCLNSSVYRARVDFVIFVPLVDYQSIS